MEKVLVKFSLFMAGAILVNTRSVEIGNTEVKNSVSEKQSKASLVEFYQKSMPAVMGMLSFNETADLITKTYLTDKKEDSIWPKVIEETKTWFGKDFSQGKLEVIELELKKYRMVLVRCTEENTGKELTRCLASLKDALIAGSANVEWLAEQGVPKMLNMYTAFQLMQLASLQLLKIQNEKDAIKGLNIDQSIKNVAKDFSEEFKTAMGIACEQRVEHITTVEICKVVDVLWQEFTLSCEERLRKRSTDEEDEASGDEVGVTKKTLAEADARSDFTKEKGGELKLSKLGGSRDDFSESLRASVKDRVTGQFIYNKRYFMHLYLQYISKLLQNTFVC